MKFQVYPRGIWIAIDDFAVQAIETSMSGTTMIVHAPGLQFPAMNGVEFIETDTFARDFIEMSPQRWIRTRSIQSMRRFGDDYVRVMLKDVRQPFDLFPDERTLKQVYNDFRALIPNAPSFLALDEAA